MTTPSEERDPGQTGIGKELAVSRNGSPPPAKAELAYCAFCGEEVGEGVPERFAERFCSEAHAEEFVRGVRAARVEAAAVAPGAEAERVEAGQSNAATSGSWKQALKMATCCGAPMLALVVLAGGGGALLGAAMAASRYASPGARAARGWRSTSWLAAGSAGRRTSTCRGRRAPMSPSCSSG